MTGWRIVRTACDSLRMAGPLVVCVACSSHVLTSDKACPHCGAAVHDGKGQVLGRTATAVLMGLALAGCPADDDSGDSMGGGGSSSSSTATTNADSSGPSGTSMGSTAGSSSTTDDSGSTAITFDSSGAQAAYGSPDTETFGSTDITESDSTSSGGDTDTDTDSDTGPGTTTGAPLYGAAPSDE